MAARPAKRGLQSPRKQVKFFFLYSGIDGQGARAFGVSRHGTKQLLPHGRQVSVGLVHSQRTMETYLQAASTFAEWAAAEYDIRSVPEMLRHPEWGAAFLATLVARGITPKTQGAYLTAVIKLVEVVCPGRRGSWLALRDLVPRAIAPGNRAWSDDQAAQLLKFVTARDPEVGLALRVIQETGARVHEVLRSKQHWHHALHVGQVRAGEIKLVGKGGKEHSVAISEDFERALRVQAADHAPNDYLFAVPSSRLYAAIRAARRTLYLPEGGAHPGRYRYAQHEHADLLTSGATTDEADRRISAQLGHVRPEITKKYLAKAKRRARGGRSGRE